MTVHCRLCSGSHSHTVNIDPGLNTMRPRQDGRHFPDYIFKSIFLNENVWIFIKISLAFIPKGPIKNIPALVYVMPWCRPGDKPLSEPMMINLLTHICVTRPQWVNTLRQRQNGCHFAGGSLRCIFLNENAWILIISSKFVLNSLRPSDAYMRRWTGSSLVQIMACRLFGAKPLSEPMLEYC